MKTKKIFYSTLMMLFTFVLTCCSSDDDFQEFDVVFEYTEDQIQEINDLQNEYNVSFKFPVKSKSQLPTIKDIEVLCKITSMMTKTSKQICRGNNRISFSSNNNRNKKTRTAPEYGGTIYNGSSGELKYDNYSYGIFIYEISWEDVIPTLNKGTVSCSILEWPECDDWRFEETGFTYNIEGCSTINYSITIKAIYDPINQSSTGTEDETFEFRISDDCQMS